jgi:SHS2 domain-containing protein
MPYEYLEDEALADIAFQARGATLNEMFHDAGMAVCTLLTDIDKLSRDRTIPFNLEAQSLDRMLYNFLDEIIFLKDAELFFAKEIQILEITKGEKWILDGNFVGCEFDQKIHTVGNDIKAITFHELYVKETTHGWESHVIVDI